MKKIFTLLMALTLVFSVSAAPVTLPAGKKSLPLKEVVKKADFAKLPQIDKKQGKVAFGEKASVPFHAAKANKPANRARKAAQDFLTPDYAQAIYLGNYYADADGYWQLSFLSDTVDCGWVQFQAADSAHINFDGDVTLHEVVFAEGDTVNVTGHLTVQGLRWEGSDPVYKLVFSGVDANNRPYSFDVELPLYAFDYAILAEYSRYVQYGIITIQQLYAYAAMELKDVEVEETGNTYDLEFLSYRKVVESGQYAYTDFVAQNDTFSAYFSFLTDQLSDGIYPQEELDLDYCYLTDKRGAEPVKIVFEALSLEVSFDGDTTFIVADEVLAKDGNRYNILVKYFIPQPQSFVDLGAFNGNQTFDDDDNFLYYGYTADSAHYAQFALTVDTIFGTFSLDDMYDAFFILNNKQDTIYPIVNFNAEIVRSQPTVATATVSMLSNDLVQYNFTLDFTVAHEPTSVIIPVELDTVANISFGEYPYDFYGYTLYQKYFVVSAANDKYAVAVGILADTIQNDTVYEAGSFYDAMILDVDADSAVYSSSDASLHVFKVADTTFFNLDFLSYQTGDLYRVSMRYYIPEATDTVRFAADKGVSRDLVYSSSMFMVNAAHQISADSAYLISLFVLDASDLYGDFNQNSLYGAPLALVVGTDTKDTTDIDVLVADIHIVPSNGDSALATVYAQGRDNIIYDFSVKFALRDAFADDAADGIDLTFEFDKSQINLSQTVPYDTLMVGAVVGTDNYFLSMRFLTNAVAIANGDYSIDDVNNAYNHVNASHGSQLFFDESYGFYSDWTGAFLLKNLNYLTYEAEATWYLQSGSVTVSDAQIEINAVNSNGKEVHVIIKRTATALEDLILDKAAPRKVLDNGRVVIIRDGKAFGLDGRRIR